MVHIPAFCNSCGAAFNSGFVADNCANLSLSGNISGPCPRCGGMGSVIDGVFNVAQNTIEILSAPDWTHEKLQKLAGILKSSAAKHSPPDELVSKLQSETKEFSAIAQYVPKNATELVAWLTFILLAIQTVSGLSKGDTPSTTVILNQSIEQSMEPNNYYPFTPQAIPPSRNSSCFCGSSKRYKHCCGKII